MTDKQKSTGKQILSFVLAIASGIILVLVTRGLDDSAYREDVIEKLTKIEAQQVALTRRLDGLENDVNCIEIDVRSLERYSDRHSALLEQLYGD